VPVLARTLETAGFATILVTMMPFWAEKIGAPRTLAVEFPFGHTLGQPGEVEQQRRVILAALQVLETAEAPGTIVHSEEKWTLPQKETFKAWQPEEPSPIIAELAPRIRKILREQRRRNN
jgi:D-proline reductase (dithiol) PrdB